MVEQGALIVRRDMRGQGLATPVMDGLAKLIQTLGSDRAMIFCDPQLISLYRRRGYVQITDPEWADQSAGPVEMPLAAMWRPLRPASWPAGTVRLHGLPF